MAKFRGRVRKMEYVATVEDEKEAKKPSETTPEEITQSETVIATETESEKPRRTRRG